ncbi:MAG: WYL domain-containing protein, partial [Lachnospiraceae bacterium]|nr:WYL domain-containing protein [Lachnospiraceae bacterium]
EMQIEMTYGIYDLSETGIDYHERMAQGEVRVYTLNPYALHWNGGHYYLLATYVKGFRPSYVKEDGTPVNFRVDRIVSIMLRKKPMPVGKKKKADAGVYVKREPIPWRLNEFLKEYPDEAIVFDSQGYGARFPAMRISEHSRLIDCRLECTAWSLQILVDTFGNVLEVKKSSRPHEAEEKDYNGRDQDFLEAVIKSVEFENIRDFCLMHPEYITPLGPPELVEAVREKLMKAVKRLEKK